MSTAALVELNHAVTGEYGAPGIETALSLRDRPVGPPRGPLRLLEDGVLAELRTALEATSET